MPSMYFPDDMNFQYLFFSTYIGDFLQMIPIALLTFVLYLVYKRKTAPALSGPRLVLSALFPAYLAALLGLTLFAAMISDAYYILFYHQLPWPVGEGGYRWFTFVYDFQVTFFQDFSAENLGNILLFLPFGILYPLFRQGSTWKRTLLMGVVTSLLIENIQPLMDRSFDLNDVVLNAVGVAISTFLFYTLRHLLGKQHR